MASPENLIFYGIGYNIFGQTCSKTSGISAALLTPSPLQLEVVLYAYHDINHIGERLILDTFTKHTESSRQLSTLYCSSLQTSSTVDISKWSSKLRTYIKVT